jgi:LacI family transcriptional regulator
MDMVSPPLTTVRIKQREMGAEAARLLLMRIDGQDVPADILLRTELVPRRSTAAPRNPQRS